MPSQPKPRKPGRPKLAKGEAKVSIVPIRFTAEDRKKVEGAAKARGQTLSDWIRNTLLTTIDGETA